MNKALKTPCISCGRIISPRELMCAPCLREVEGRKKEIRREREARIAKRREEEEINTTIREFASRQSGLS